jgi:hypothetical protein
MILPAYEIDYGYAHENENDFCDHENDCDHAHDESGCIF